MEVVNKKILSRGYSSKVLGCIIGIILILLLTSIAFFIESQDDSKLYFQAVFCFVLAIIVYFIALFSHNEEEIDIEKQTIFIQYPYSFKKGKVIPLTEILGYYIYADGGLRRIVLVLKDKRELKFSDTYDSFFKYFQDYIFENYQMISHKNYKVYSEKRKEHELYVYRSLPPIIAKTNYEHETFEIHALWMAGVLGLLYFTFFFETIFSVIHLICLGLIVISYFWIKSRKAKLNSKKDEWDADLYK